mgnify:CR=1 FL=1
MTEPILKKCSRCGSKKLLKLFHVREKTGAIYKTCMSCCERIKPLEKIEKDTGITQKE